MGYYSMLKRNELLNHEKTWRKGKYILLSEKSYSESAMYYMIPTSQRLGKGKIMQTVKKCWFSGFKWEGGINRWNTEDF